MDPQDVRSRAELFRALHAGPELLVVPNPWDRGTARLFEHAGFRALATTSAGLAFSLGRRDGDGAVSADETFDHVATLVAATRLPVTADLENGFGRTPEDVARTIRRAVDAGLAGASIVDASYHPTEPLNDASLAAERIAAAAEVVRGAGRAFMLTARAENFLRGRPDLDDVLARLTSFERAGADVLYAPGLPDAHAVRLVCRSVNKPVNFVVGIGAARFSLTELAALGVRRVSIGTSFVRAALGAALRAASEVLEHGTFGYLDGIPSLGAINEKLDPRGAG